MRSLLRFSASVLMCWGTATVAAAHLQTGGAVVPTTEYQLKAAYFVNFARYIEWPAEAFASESTSLTLCVLEPSPFGDALARLVEGETIQKRTVVVQVISRSSQARSCHLLFVSAKQKAEADSLLSQLEDFPIVTVGELSTFNTSGGAIKLVTVAGQIRFEINLAAVERRGIRMSSRLLGLASVVHKE